MNSGKLALTTGKKPSPLRIALLGYRSHPYVGGQGIYLKFLSRALAARGHKVTVYSGPPYPDLDPSVRLIKVPSLDLYGQQDQSFKFRYLRSFTDGSEWFSKMTGGFSEPYTFGRRIQKLIHKGDYDIVHDNQSLCFGLLELQKRGLNVVATIHHPIHRDRDLAIEAAPNWGMKALARRWYGFLRMQEKVTKKLNYVITVSKTSQTDIYRYFARETHNTPVVFNGVDADVFYRKKTIKEKPFTLLTTASSDQPLKGLKTLLFALKSVLSEFPQTRLIVIGKLKENGDTQKTIEKLALQSHIDFISNLSTDELVEKYNEASLVICPSLYEGFGLPALEAMACEKAVISSDGGALPEVIGDSGLIYPAGNSLALSQAIISLTHNELKRKSYAKKARQRVEKLFSWEQVACQLESYYKSILAKH